MGKAEGGREWGGTKTYMFVYSTLTMSYRKGEWRLSGSEFTSSMNEEKENLTLEDKLET